MGSRKRRRERDAAASSSKKQKRRSRSLSRSPSKSRSRSRSRSPLTAPPPPTLSSRSIQSSKYDRDGNDRDYGHNYDERDRDRRHHRKHKEHKRRHHQRDKSPIDSKCTSDYRGSSRQEPEYHSDSSDVVEVPLAPPAPIISKKTKSPSPIPENGAGDCLSIDETNKLRAKLGLKPLEVDSKSGPSSSSSKPKVNADGNQMHKDEWGEFYHKPADNLAVKLQAEKLREKFLQRKEKREQEKKLKSIKTLGESDDVDDISDWVERSREKAKLRAEAERRAKILEEMDDEFGVGELVQRETRREQKKLYSGNHLKGLRVDHDLDSFSEGKTVVLTLKDQDVLDEENSDTLVNVNMIDDERYRKNIDNRKLNPNQYGYDVYQDEVDEFGQPIQRNILSKYDDEIRGATMKPSFTIGQNVEEEIAHRRKLLEIKTKLSGKRLETLDEPLTSLASDTYTETELATFKKPKKKIKKLRKKLKAEDLEPLPTDLPNSSKDFRKRDPRRHLNDVIETDDVPAVKPNQTDIKHDDEEDNELEHVLSKARRLKQSEALISKTLNIDATNIKAEIKTERSSEDEETDLNGHKEFITLNATAEFCRTLGDIPTYGMSGNRDVDANDMMDMESEPDDNNGSIENEERSTGTWNSVNPNVETLPSEKKLELTEVAILDEEPDVASGMGAALKLALSKGYLEKEETNRPSNTRMAHLQAKNYSIEDKSHGDDDKFNRRDRFHAGPISEFKEKDSYKPNVKLEYIDDNGHLLNEKEAFRYLSHKFHGKGPGKNKIEKRLKKNEQDGLMMKMSSTDTPLGTLTMLQHKQKETHSPYIVLSGSKQIQTATSITKHK